MSKFLNLPAEYSNLGGKATTPKRKNGEDSENTTPSATNSQPAKRIRAAVPVSVAKSALPRFQSARAKTVAEIRNASPVRGLVSALEQGARAVLGAMRSPPPSSQTKPAKPVADTPSKETSVSSAVPVPVAGPTIKELFDTGFTVDDERVLVIMGGLRCKSKWDMKEKSNKQATVITDLRAALKTTFEEIQALKEKSVVVEANLTASLQRIISEFAMSRQQVAMLSKEDVRLKQELKELADSIKSLQNEKSDIQGKLYEADSKAIRLTSALAGLENRVEEREMEISRLQEEIQRNKCDYELRVEQLLGGYKDEVASLRTELGRSSLGRAEISRQAVEQKEELLHAYAQIKELTGEVERKSADVDDLKAEVVSMKEALASKESDTRAALQSLQEVQRVTAEEKMQLRSEVNSLQGKLVHFEDDRISTASQLAAKIEELSGYMRENSRLKEKLGHKEEELQAGKDSHIMLEVEKDLRVRAEVREENERRERIASTAQLLATQTECAERLHRIEEQCLTSVEGIKQTLRGVETARDNLIKELTEARDEAAGRGSEILILKRELEHASVNSVAQEELASLKGEMEILKRRLQEKVNLQVAEGNQTSARIRELEGQLIDAENQRRKLRNMIAELKGNVRVFARVRPFLPSDDADMNPESSLVVSADNATIRIRGSKGEEQQFTFDKAFNPSAAQEAIFGEVNEFVQSALDGYNVCLFSYGQTGSGKTHTMTGSGTGSMRGIIPRAMQQVGTYKTELECKGWEYFMEVSFIEIYNETIRDLLRAQYSEEIKHEIKRDASGSSYVSDVTMLAVDPNDTDMIDSIMEKAARYRSTASTAMNEQSSRSHSIFTLHLRANNKEQGVSLKGNLSLVDLAGSERIDRSGAVGSRLKEAVAINKSLSSLVDVFSAIASKQAHIPFRNSKLTYLLQPALSGEGKTLMMVNLSPTEDSFNESLCSLRFAAQVNQCELGKAKRQIKEAPLELKATPTEKSISSTPTSQAKKIARMR